MDTELATSRKNSPDGTTVPALRDENRGLRQQLAALQATSGNCREDRRARNRLETLLKHIPEYVQENQKSRP